MKSDSRKKVHKPKVDKNMIIGTKNHCAAASISTSNLKGSGTDFSIAAIMARGGSSREPSERSISMWKIFHLFHMQMWKNQYFFSNECKDKRIAILYIQVFLLFRLRISWNLKLSFLKIVEQNLGFQTGFNFLSGPVSVDRFPEGDDEVDVDVEQCSDSEAPSRSRTPRSASNNSRATPHSDEERLSPEPVRKKQVIFNRFVDSSW